MKKFNLVACQKKGSLSMNKTTNTIIGILIAVILITAFAPSIFGELNNWSNITGMPSWLVTVGPIIVGVAFLYMLYRMIR